MGIVNSTPDPSSLARGNDSFSSERLSLREVTDFVYEFHKPRDWRTDVDIVFFHGVPFQQGGCSDAYKRTWSSDELKSFWPQTLLAKDFPNSRILSVRYEDYKQLTLEIDLIENDNVGVGQRRPVILIGHCFGGFVIKKLLLSAWKKMKSSQTPNVAMENFFRNLRGIFFYSTPHLGIAPDAEAKLGNFTLSLMKTLNDEANELHEDFNKLKESLSIRVTAAGEANATLVNRHYVTIVNEASASHDMDEYYVIPDSDHYSVCRPLYEYSLGFQCLSHFINKDCRIRRSPPTTPMGSFARASFRVSKVFNRLLTPPGSKK